MAAAALKANPAPAMVQTDQLAVLCKALADNLRLKILRLLKSESFGVLELCHILDIKQSLLSHHLKILSTADLLTTRREGNSIFYRRLLLVISDPFLSIKRSLFDNIDCLPLPDDQLKRIRFVHLERSRLSLSFFNRNADKFREKQGLITEYTHYAKNLLDLLDALALDTGKTAMEVGPGEGELLAQLATQFERVIAVDNSKEMLERAKNCIASAQRTNVQFILGDTTVAKKKNRSDLLIFNMVLHHISSPAKTFKEASEILNPGGTLLIVDLWPHDQDWVRESCGDIWLGFDENDLCLWAEKANLSVDQSSYLGLRNGFQIQMRLFSKSAQLAP